MAKKNKNAWIPWAVGGAAVAALLFFCRRGDADGIPPRPPVDEPPIDVSPILGMGREEWKRYAELSSY